MQLMAEAPSRSGDRLPVQGHENAQHMDDEGAPRLGQGQIARIASCEYGRNQGDTRQGIRYKAEAEGQLPFCLVPFALSLSWHDAADAVAFW